MAAAGTESVPANADAASRLGDYGILVSMDRKYWLFARMQRGE
jgi:hypothetical protein